MVLALGSSGLLLFVTAFQWSLVDVLTPFLLMPVQAVAWLAVLLVLATSGLRNQRLSLRPDPRPALVCGAAICLALFFPFTNLWLTTNFWWHRSEREAVVRKIQSRGPWPPTSPLTVPLPAGTPNLSTGGNDVLVEEHDGQLYVLFFTYRGILDNYSGFLFVQGRGEPKRFLDLKEAGSSQVRRFGEHWYFVAHR